jgi:hypothetical protein
LENEGVQLTNKAAEPDPINLSSNLQSTISAAATKPNKTVEETSVLSTLSNAGLNQQLIISKKPLIPPRFTGQRPFYDQKSQTYNYTRPRPCPKAPFEDYLKRVERFIRDKIKLSPEHTKPTDVNRTA